MKPTEAGETIASSAYSLGLLTGYKQVAENIRKLAGELFAKDQDIIAKQYRDLAAELEKQTYEMRAKYDADKQAERDTAFEFLDDLEKHYNWREAAK